VPVDDAEVVLYDALIDPDLAIEVLHLVAPDVEVEVRRPIVLEHSNSSVVFDEATILKVLRKIEKGPNPDVEITRVLAEHGYQHVLPPLAELRRHDTDLAVVRHFLVGATEGWQLARASVRDLLASRLPPEECGGDFAPDSARLGDVIAGLHIAMAAAWDSAPGEPARWVDQMGGAIEVLAGQPGTEGFDADLVRARLDDARALDDGGREIRIHGDLHLSQVIQVDTGWLVLDFEGEPARRRDERFTMSSPLRDVAGMLRSVHYAAATGLAEWDQGDVQLVELVAAWEERNRSAFLTAYEAHEGIDDLLPKDPAARAVLLGAFELDKAVYELGYELGHRPELAAIPLAGIERLVRGPVSTS
jgi:maltokinase